MHAEGGTIAEFANKCKWSISFLEILFNGIIIIMKNSREFDEALKKARKSVIHLSSQNHMLFYYFFPQTGSKDTR